MTVTVNWLGLDGVPSADDIPYVTATNAAGQYLVSDLPFGNYTVVVDPGTLGTTRTEASITGFSLSEHVLVRSSPWHLR